MSLWYMKSASANTCSDVIGYIREVGKVGSHQMGTRVGYEAARVVQSAELCLFVTHVQQIARTEGIAWGLVTKGKVCGQMRTIAWKQARC